ncbi:MAG: acetyl-CoA carboxylase biotin carboxyl carrier protein [Lachnospiraceae bacterium]|uniref:acetyl-CoA carboxylase biotin carboxyl carrier protein n=1 Tax=Candidatus Merdisoma sp. JLR.KK011 TaxID=3114299 RepID=UPI0014342471|nr:acetyl-CoA carboxylase biotin carboxyl carrier protein [Lachnospiraceae bacterium]MCI9382779.1 acetyl-CoA carboxylase biotin carboxyl carrier protein [Lachnospiraceae bacterium]MCI9622483.1 acetyl-CoA carboxylase biotin carboxyl carrier protein [Lachnospiraceae bacterium]GFI07622.1 biotin carboxyl carrier protein of acetyl-CoA carboxylase [Lachnospiraceae bacterium]
MEFENLLRLVECVSNSGLDSFYYEQNGTKIRLKKSRGTALKGAPAAIAAEPEQLPKSSASIASSVKGMPVKSPLVGVFYAAPSEDAEPFVSVGSRVKKGQTLGIVEAMKLMNEIESDCDGVVTEICVQNGDTVEYGQPLFVVSAE